MTHATFTTPKSKMRKLAARLEANPGPEAQCPRPAEVYSDSPRSKCNPRKIQCRRLCYLGKV